MIVEKKINQLKERELLQDRVAFFKSKLILKYIDSLSISDVEKKKLLNDLIKKLEENGTKNF